MNYFLIAFLAVFLLPVFGQPADTLTLDRCYELVRENAPQLALLDVHKERAALEQQKINSANMPQVSAYGKAWYQSDAIAVVVPQFPDFGMEIDKFQYNAALNIDQVLYNGGIAKIRKELALIQSEVSGLETEAGLNKLNALVNKYYFGILSLEETSALLGLKYSQLAEKEMQLQSAVANGVVLKADLNRLQAEKLKTNQQVSDVELNKKKLSLSLKVLIGIELATDITLDMPQEKIVTDSIYRPELEAFRANKLYIDKAQQLQNRRYLPKFAAYGQAGYMYPGLNFFENEPAGFYMAGIKMSWNIFDWNQSKTEKQLLELNREQINVQESDFKRNIHIEIANINAELENLEHQLKLDEEIIAVYETATESSAVALENGSITSVDYLSDLNAELGARIEQKYHEIQKLEAQARLSVVMGQTENKNLY